MPSVSRLLARLCRSLPARVIETGDKPYLYRIFLFELLGWRCYLHHFVSADAERWLHDHPFDGLSIVLTGSYIEERLTCLDWPTIRVHERRIRWFNYVAGTCFHRVLSPRPDTWTLFLHSPKYKGWGFLERTDFGVVYRNPFGNVGQAKWWRVAPTYQYLRMKALHDANLSYIDSINHPRKIL